MEAKILRPWTLLIQGLILVFSLCLTYFVFVYYPDVVHGRKFSLNLGNPFVQKVSASVNVFPIATKSYKITYESGSKLYYAFISGNTLDQFVENKNAAQLALKNALEEESLCQEKIIFSSTARLVIPEAYKNASNCR